jgi:phosphatidylglycerol:prolipoprotein diacylglycerol transferase
LLWWFSSKPRPRCSITGLFGVGYGVFRFFVEFARQPDADIGFIAFDWLTMGQLLSLPMIVIGAAMMVYGYRRDGAVSNAKHQ